MRGKKAWLNLLLSFISLFVLSNLENSVHFNTVLKKTAGRSENLCTPTPISTGYLYEQQLFCVVFNILSYLCTHLGIIDLVIQYLYAYCLIKVVYVICRHNTNAYTLPGHKMKVQDHIDSHWLGVCRHTPSQWKGVLSSYPYNPYLYLTVDNSWHKQTFRLFWLVWTKSVGL